MYSGNSLQSAIVPMKLSRVEISYLVLINSSTKLKTMFTIITIFIISIFIYFIISYFEFKIEKVKKLSVEKQVIQICLNKYQQAYQKIFYSVKDLEDLKLILKKEHLQHGICYFLENLDYTVPMQWIYENKPDKQNSYWYARPIKAKNKQEILSCLIFRKMHLQEILNLKKYKNI